MKILTLILTLILSFAGYYNVALASPNVDDPTQSVRFWKPFAVSQGENKQVAIAQRIFSQLLRTWNHQQRFIPPSLYVVNSETGPWAASLADGNILLSLQALEIALGNSKKGEDYLAFMLAHELAHQQNDDMWHLKFFRLAGTQTPETRKLMMRGLTLDENTILDLENREAKADEDGIVIMSMVGFDPFNIVGDTSFFTQWAQAIWNTPCDSTSLDINSKTACQQAASRTTRATAKLNAIANKSLLFELGVQAYVAGNYHLARRYFSAFEKSFPGHAVYDNIGLTYLTEILSLKKTHRPGKLPTILKFTYPITLETSAFSKSFQKHAATRGASQAENTPDATLKKKIHHLSEMAIPYFERAIKINPGYQSAYLHLGICYLLQENLFMAKGILQGKYQTRFGNDDKLNLLLAIIDYLEEDTAGATRLLQQLADTSEDSDPYLQYAIFSNLAMLFEFKNDDKNRKKVWKKLAKLAKKQSHGTLFQLAISKLKKQKIRPRKNKKSEINIAGFSIKDSLSGNNKNNENNLWIDGEKFQRIKLDSGQFGIIDKENKLINLWQSNSSTQNIIDIHVNDNADRPLKKLGVPERQIMTPKGLYLAYDSNGVAFRINNNKISGWFLYTNNGMTE